MQGLTGVFSLRGQIAAHERRNVNLTASNTSLRKANAELSAEREGFSFKITKLKSKNEELGDNYAELVRVNEKLTGELDAAKEGLAKERAENSGLREELEAAMLKVQSIAVDAVLSARAELMEEFKRGEHASWDLDQEIETWKKREAALGGVRTSPTRKRMRRLLLRKARRRRRQSRTLGVSSQTWELRRLRPRLRMLLRVQKILPKTSL